MPDLCRYLVAVAAALLCSACTSHSSFVRNRDFDVGSIVTLSPFLSKPLRIESLDSKTSRYIYEFRNTGCQWAYIVDNTTKEVLSWEYVSDPKLCYMSRTILN